MAIRVQEQSPEVKAMAPAWAIAEALTGGTAAMRKAGKAYLPRWPNEVQASYDARLATATLFPAFGRTVSVMTGKPFSKQLTLGDDVPQQIATWCQDCDMQGNSLHNFSADVLSEAMAFGLCGVLVDYPKDTAARTVAEEKATGARPYMVFVRHDRLLGWKWKTVNGAAVITQLRLSESVEVDDGEFGTTEKRRVRVLEPGAYRLFQETDKKDEYILIEEGLTTLKSIPFVPFYGRKTGFMSGVSPLQDLAHLNVKHWQSQSDQDTIMHVVRVPVLAVIGIDDDKWSLTVGASAAVKLPMGSDMKYVEHTGASIEAGERSLEKLEAQMIQTGAELLVAKPGAQRTATESNNDAEANKSDLQRITESHEDGIDQVLQYVADWARLPEGGHVELFKDFAAGSLTDASAQLVVSLQQAGLITKETAIREQQRRGILAPDIDPVAELAAVSEEGPALGTMGGDQNANGQ